MIKGRRGYNVVVAAFVVAALAVATLAAVNGAAGATRTVGPADDLRQAVANLTPGDELVLAPGTYQFSRNLTFKARGLPDAPIVIRADPTAPVVLEQLSGRHNVLEIRDSAHLVLQGLVITGGSHGIRLIDSNAVTIADCEIRDTGDVGLSANAGGTYRGLRIVRNHIHHTNGTGEGIYLGCNHDTCRVADSLIAGNYIHHTNGPSVLQGDGIEIKEGSSGNVIRDNVIHDTRYPGILVYSTAGNGPPNVIEGNAVWGAEDNALQVAADAIVRNNILLGRVAFRAHQAGSPSNIEFVHNTVVNERVALEVRDVVGRVVIANNALYSARRAIRLVDGAPDSLIVAGNIGLGGLWRGREGYREGQGLAADMAAAQFANRTPSDVFPTPDSALIDAADPRFQVSVDYNGTQRFGIADVGAFEAGDGRNPGPPVVSGPKYKLSYSEYISVHPFRNSSDRVPRSITPE